MFCIRLSGAANQDIKKYGYDGVLIKRGTILYSMPDAKLFPVHKEIEMTYSHNSELSLFP